MQIKKLGALALAVATFAGLSGIASAQTLGEYPQPFIDATGADDFLIVVGGAAATSDVAGAINVAARLGGETGTDVTTSGVTTVTVSGEGKEIATTNTKLYLNDTLKKTGARTTLTKADLPTILASGTLQDSDASTTYDYDLYIDLSDDYYFTFAQHTPADLITVDPTIVMKHTSGTNPTNPHADSFMYRTKLVFEKDVNGTTAVDETIDIFGRSYTVAPTTDFDAASPKLVLFGSQETVVLTEQESVVVEVEGVEYTVELNGVSSATACVVTVEGDTRSVTAGTTYTFNSGLQVHISDVYFYGSTRTDNQAKLGIGAETWTFEDEKKIVYGTGGDTENIDGTQVNLTINSNKLTTLEVYVGPEKSSMDALIEGESFTDPIFGSFDLNFNSVTPGLTSEARNMLQILPSGDDGLTATWTDYYGDTATFTYAYDADSIGLEDASGYAFNVVEGETIHQNEYIVLDAGDFTHLMRISDLDNDGSATASIEFYDLFAGSTHEYTLGADGRVTAYIDGQAYYIHGDSNTTLTVTWGDGADYSDVGNQHTVFPKIRGKYNDYISLMNASTVVNLTALSGKSLELPSGRLDITGWVESGHNMINISAASGYTTTVTNANMSYSMNASSLGDVAIVKLGKSSTGGAYWQLLVTATDTIKVTPVSSGGTAIHGAEGSLMLIEEQDDDNNIYTLTIPTANETSGSVTQIMAASPDFMYTTRATATFKTDTYKTGYLDKYGVYAERNTYNQDTVTVYYPDDQMTIN
ncbi:hypothetical protein ACFLQN_03460, partial [Candidatus Aenigmatarchaeota archaeon]